MKLLKFIPEKYQKFLAAFLVLIAVLPQFLFALGLPDAAIAVQGVLAIIGIPAGIIQTAAAGAGLTTALKTDPKK